MSTNVSVPPSVVPKIVISEPSPVPLENGFGIVPPNFLPQTSVKPVVTHQSDVSSGPESDVVQGVPLPVPDIAVLEGSGGFQPLPDVHVVMVNGETSSSASNEDPGFRETESDANDLRSVWNCSECYYKWIKACQNSKLVIPMQLLFLAIPITAGCMGYNYVGKCPMSVSTPFLLFMMGVCGGMVILCRLIMILQVAIDTTQVVDTMVLTTIVIFGNAAIILLFLTELVSFAGLTPSFQIDDPNYCNETFYTFTYWMNWCAFFLILLMVVLCVPRNCRRNP